MPLFQERIVQKYLNQIEEQEIETAYDVFRTHYSPKRIQNIRTLKEEAFQEQFIKEIFGSVLGYSVYPDVSHNIEIERKNESNAKKADGAIVKEKSVLGVIELKDNKTKNLDKVADQAFGYKHNHKDCSYVISSNFHKLRFYIDDATDYEEFDLYNLDKETFKRFYLYLRKEGLLDKNVPKLLRKETKFHEENITKKLYKDYSDFKNSFYSNIVKNNPEQDKLLLYKKAQKFLDRVLFILFAEDKDLIPHNTIVKIVESWNEADDFHYLPLYEMLNILFGHLDKGHTYKDGTKIPAYNGGLFAEDELLKNLKVDDSILKDDLLKLSKYDFNTDVDVNILGHIFEHSLSELEEVEAALRGEEADKAKGKRKKDGVFYTPKYITKYIVDNTIGKLCEEKKAELGLDQDFDVFDYQTKGGKLNTKGKEFFETIDTYRNWLLGLKILDPACGSGAFLNQALNFLIDEHNFIDDLVAELTNTPLRLFDTELVILENNIYGVDINEESIEIAKLSLWLRTAQPGRKLSNLNNNIKCGNSLIDDPEVAGDKAFKWEDEFPEVFAKGGFDVVIGNPPYVKRQNIEDENQIIFLEKNYESATYNFDLYLLFIEKGSKLIKETGLVSYINPSKFTSTKTGAGLRGYLESNCNIITYIDFKEYQVFADATTYCCIFILNNETKGKTEYLELNELKPTEIDSYTKYEIEIKETASGLGWQFKPTVEIKGKYHLKEFVHTFTGIESGADNIYILEKDNPQVNFIIEYLGEVVFPVIKGTNVYRYYFEETPYYGIVPYDEDKSLIPIETLKDKYRKAYSYLLENKEVLEGREKGKMKNESWYGYVYPKNLYKYHDERLIWTDISIKPQFVIDKTKSWHVRTVCSLELNELDLERNLTLELLLGILNSNLFFYFIKNNSNSVRGGYFRYKPQYVKEFPIPDHIEKSAKGELEESVNDVAMLTQKMIKSVNSYNNYLQSQFSGIILSKKLQSWYDLDFGVFIKELNKAIKKAGKEKLSKSDEMEWMDLFESKKKEVLDLKEEIDKTDREIDQMVYALYGLSEEEIKIVEES